MDRWELYKQMLEVAKPELIAVFGVDMIIDVFTLDGEPVSLNIICTLDNFRTAWRVSDRMIEDNNVEVEYLVKQTLKALVHDLQFARLEKQIELINLKEED